MDVAGIPTTAGCSEFTYVPEKSARVIEMLEEAGALLIGKTNLDQFATGLVGTRSPYGAVKNSYNPEYISGGSSSGSAVALSLGMASFSLGTDTAGSGRVPAGFNNLFGYKPTRGVISTNGIVPACKSLDCVSIFCLNSTDAAYLLKLTSGLNPGHVFNERKLKLPERFRFIVPQKDQLEFFGNTENEAIFYKAVEYLQTMGGTMKEVDFGLFKETAELLYEGPWVAERLASIEEFFNANADSLLAETKSIIEGGKNFSAVDTFQSLYKLEDLKKFAKTVFEDIDLFVVPTAPTIFTIREVQQNPFTLNTQLGYYTNFVNLLDLCALSVPVGMQKNGVPMGVTLISTAYNDHFLLSVGQLFKRI
jgi:allophanate hydrolase